MPANVQCLRRPGSARQTGSPGRGAHGPSHSLAALPNLGGTAEWTARSEGRPDGTRSRLMPGWPSGTPEAVLVQFVQQGAPADAEEPRRLRPVVAGLGERPADALHLGIAGYPPPR